MVFIHGLEGDAKTAWGGLDPLPGTDPGRTCFNTEDTKMSPVAPENSPREIVLLVHGIRTDASWQPMVKKVLEEVDGLKVIPLKYGFYSLWQFGLPFPFRGMAVKEVKESIQQAQLEHPTAKVSIIAHSNGCYIVSKILASEKNLKLRHLIFCGSVVKRKFPWTNYSFRIETEIINEYGTNDIYPVLAEGCSLGYGATGRFGFGKSGIHDRAHDFGHSDYFASETGKGEDFVREWWKPVFEGMDVKNSDHSAKSRYRVFILLYLRYFITFVIVAAMALLVYRCSSGPPTETAAPDPPELKRNEVTALYWLGSHLADLPLLEKIRNEAPDDLRDLAESIDTSDAILLYMKDLGLDLPEKSELRRAPIEIFNRAYTSLDWESRNILAIGFSSAEHRTARMSLERANEGDGGFIESMTEKKEKQERLLTQLLSDIAGHKVHQNDLPDLLAGQDSEIWQLLDRASRLEPGRAPHERLPLAKFHGISGYVYTPYVPSKTVKVPSGAMAGDKVECPFTEKFFILPENFVKSGSKDHE